MSRFDDRGRPARYDRDHSPDYAYAGGSGIPPPAPPPPPGVNQHARLEYEPQAPYYPPPPGGYVEGAPSGGHLQIPDARLRPRSLPPPADYRGGRSSRNRDRDWDYNNNDYDDNHRDRHRDRPRSPISRAKRAIENTFTDSTTGLGVGVLGALVGGLAAHEATDHGDGRRRPSEAQKRNQLVSTVLGAAVGALGANAVEKRLELGRERTEEKQERWEQKWGRKGGGDDHYHRGGDRGDRDWDDRRRGSSRGRQREIDPDARSWNNVEDWVYDSPGGGDRSRDRRGGRRSEEGYRY